MEKSNFICDWKLNSKSALKNDECCYSYHRILNCLYKLRSDGNKMHHSCNGNHVQSEHMIYMSPVDKLIADNRMKMVKNTKKNISTPEQQNMNNHTSKKQRSRNGQSLGNDNSLSNNTASPYNCMRITRSRSKMFGNEIGHRRRSRRLCKLPPIEIKKEMHYDDMSFSYDDVTYRLMHGISEDNFPGRRCKGKNKKQCIKKEPIDIKMESINSDSLCGNESFEPVNASLSSAPEPFEEEVKPNLLSAPELFIAPEVRIGNNVITPINEFRNEGITGYYFDNNVVEQRFLNNVNIQNNFKNESVNENHCMIENSSDYNIENNVNENNFDGGNVVNNFINEGTSDYEYKHIPYILDSEENVKNDIYNQNNEQNLSEKIINITNSENIESNLNNENDFIDMNIENNLNDTNIENSLGSQNIENIPIDKNDLVNKDIIINQNIENNKKNLNNESVENYSKSENIEDNLNNKIDSHEENVEKLLNFEKNGNNLNNENDMIDKNIEENIIPESVDNNLNIETDSLDKIVNKNLNSESIKNNLNNENNLHDKNKEETLNSENIKNDLHDKNREEILNSEDTKNNLSYRDAGKDFDSDIIEKEQNINENDLNSKNDFDNENIKNNQNNENKKPNIIEPYSKSGISLRLVTPKLLVKSSAYLMCSENKLDLLKKCSTSENLVVPESPLISDSLNIAPTNAGVNPHGTSECINNNNVPLSIDTWTRNSEPTLSYSKMSIPEKKLYRQKLAYVNALGLISIENLKKMREEKTSENFKSYPAKKYSSFIKPLTNTISNYTERPYYRTSSEKLRSSFLLEYSNDKNDKKKHTAVPILIPERSSGLSFHPDRSCMYKCSSCHGKFGSLDTPCHIAQIKNPEKQKACLENVNHLIGPKSCLCDACFRSIEKRSTKKKFTKTVCIILTCPNQATHIFKSEWVDKIKKLLNNIGVGFRTWSSNINAMPVCNAHHNEILKLTQCQLCGNENLQKYELVNVQETARFQAVLDKEGIPYKFDTELFICKPCRIYLVWLSTNNKRAKQFDLSKHRANVLRSICAHNGFPLPSFLAVKKEIDPKIKTENQIVKINQPSQPVKIKPGNITTNISVSKPVTRSEFKPVIQSIFYHSTGEPISAPFKPVFLPVSHPNSLQPKPITSETNENEDLQPGVHKQIVVEKDLVTNRPKLVIRHVKSNVSSCSTTARTNLKPNKPNGENISFLSTPKFKQLSQVNTSNIKIVPRLNTQNLEQFLHPSTSNVNKLPQLNKPNVVDKVPQSNTLKIVKYLQRNSTNVVNKVPQLNTPKVIKYLQKNSTNIVEKVSQSNTPKVVKYLQKNSTNVGKVLQQNKLNVDRILLPGRPIVSQFVELNVEQGLKPIVSNEEGVVLSNVSKMNKVNKAKGSQNNVSSAEQFCKPSVPKFMKPKIGKTEQRQNILAKKVWMSKLLKILERNREKKNQTNITKAENVIPYVPKVVKANFDNFYLSNDSSAGKVVPPNVSKAVKENVENDSSTKNDVSPNVSKVVKINVENDSSAGKVVSPNVSKVVKENVENNSSTENDVSPNVSKVIKTNVENDSSAGKVVSPNVSKVVKENVSSTEKVVLPNVSKIVGTNVENDSNTENDVSPNVSKVVKINVENDSSAGKVVSPNVSKVVKENVENVSSTENDVPPNVSKVIKVNVEKVSSTGKVVLPNVSKVVGTNVENVSSTGKVVISNVLKVVKSNNESFSRANVSSSGKVIISSVSKVVRANNETFSQPNVSSTGKVVISNVSKVVKANVENNSRPYVLNAGKIIISNVPKIAKTNEEKVLPPNAPIVKTFAIPSVPKCVKENIEKVSIPKSPNEEKFAIPNESKFVQKYVKVSQSNMSTAKNILPSNVQKVLSLNIPKVEQSNTSKVLQSNKQNVCVKSNMLKNVSPNSKVNRSRQFRPIQPALHSTSKNLNPAPKHLNPVPKHLNPAIKQYSKAKHKPNVVPVLRARVSIDAFELFSELQKPFNSSIELVNHMLAIENARRVGDLIEDHINNNENPKETVPARVTSKVSQSNCQKRKIDSLSKTDEDSNIEIIKKPKLETDGMDSGNKNPKELKNKPTPAPKFVRIPVSSLKNYQPQVKIKPNNLTGNKPNENSKKLPSPPKYVQFIPGRNLRKIFDSDHEILVTNSKNKNNIGLPSTAKISDAKSLRQISVPQKSFELSNPKKLTAEQLRLAVASGTPLWKLDEKKTF